MARKKRSKVPNKQNSCTKSDCVSDENDSVDKHEANSDDKSEQDDNESKADSCNEESNPMSPPYTYSHKHPKFRYFTMSQKDSSSNDEDSNPSDLLPNQMMLQDINDVLFGKEVVSSILLHKEDMSSYTCFQENEVSGSLMEVDNNVVHDDVSSGDIYSTTDCCESVAKTDFSLSNKSDLSKSFEKTVQINELDNAPHIGIVCDIKDPTNSCAKSPDLLESNTTSSGTIDDLSNADTMGYESTSCLKDDVIDNVLPSEETFRILTGSDSVESSEDCQKLSVEYGMSTTKLSVRPIDGHIVGDEPNRSVEDYEKSTSDKKKCKPEETGRRRSSRIRVNRWTDDEVKIPSASEVCG